ncbi:uncharacterized protein si:dkey-91i10.2 [Pristis pectinata]|uniref:uncharacterized protein si:dkey-91i10.2 n=1 Tax=Pristis pectinata TaxID=685728 RepID=UPI00223CE46A|nr:uncharacterized protein si:dkey-91i10.2 [Pristis pectinata]
MPDLSAESCDFPGASAAVCGMDIGCRGDDQPGHFDLLESGPALLRGATMTYTASVHEGRAAPCCRDSDTLSAPRDGWHLASSGQPPPTLVAPRCLTMGRPPSLVAPPGDRPYRSLEDLHRAPTAHLAGGPISPPCPGMQGKLVLRCQAASDWCEALRGPPSIDTAIRAYGDRPAMGRELPPFPRTLQWPLPAAGEGLRTGGALRGLKEKLRLLSSKPNEASKPVRPWAPMAELTGGMNCGCFGPGCPARACGTLGAASRGGPAAPPQRWAASPAEIKEEAARRLRLRRQNSTPNLALPLREGVRGEVVRSQTVGGREATGLPPRGPAEEASDRSRKSPRIHIPSFEEFKRMRVKAPTPSPEAEMRGGVEGVSRVPAGPLLTESQSCPPQRGLLAPSCNREPSRQTPLPPLGASQAQQDPDTPASPGKEHLAPPVCIGPAPSSPLQTVAIPLGSSEPGSRHQEARQRDANGPEKSSAAEAQSSCCPSLLLEAAADLSAYGVTFQQMKDGLIGSAIDLIKKSCTAESAAIEPTHHRQLDDITVNERSSQSGPVSAATLGGSIPKATAGLCQVDCRSLPNCRRSSSDAAYGTTETAKAQRECRLRPHFSDPMPADAVKRKQLEMRIAAAAWGLGQKRRQDKEGSGCPLSNPATRADDTSPTSGPRDHRLQPGPSHRPKHRWSDLSTDSGVVGLNDRSEEREEEEEEEEAEEEERARKGRPGEVERADSGIGPGTAKKWRSRVEETARSVQAWVTHRPCVDCGERDVLEPDPVPVGRRRENLCGKCAKRRRERKEAILEFVNTESSYGEDLRIIREEFHLPMQAAGLLTPEQLAVVFSNIQELIEVNEKFLERLLDSTEQAFDQNDEDFLTVCIGEMFLEFVNMLPAFQTYCIHQSSSINLLNSLEKEKELLRIFLDVSQNDNTALRRMNLRSFLMAPLQRVTKYPLLLSRISSSTPEYHPDHRGLREAKSRVESHLEHINMRSRQEGAPLWPLRSFRRGSRRHREAADVEMREVAIRAVGWPREETRFAMEGTLQSSQPSDGQWSKKGSRSLKFQNLHALLMVNKPEPEPGQEGTASGGSGWEVARDAALVLIRDKSGGKFSLFRRPIHLGNCVVSSDPDCDDTFELLEIPKEVFVFRDVDQPRTQHWFRLVKRYSQDLGSWRKRRNALPNIMINATYSRA